MINSGANLSWLPSMVIIYRFSQAYKLSSRSNNFQIPTAVLDHFTLPVHSMDNIELVPLELITSNRDAVRKARESYLISRGKTDP